ncbi:MAG TPA: TetR family transcriptional regulator [Chloroflexia bacterium]|nr:TetR family transcriptional regulator [Chloroflexia bacterium]
MAQKVDLNPGQRAVKDNQKQQRRQSILDTAWQIFQKIPYQTITMAGVAEQAGLAKGTVYLYFKTKEELFLTIQEQQLESWFDEIEYSLTEERGRLSIEQLARLLCQSLEERTSFTRLLAIMHSILEQNIDFETALRFKQMLARRMQQVGNMLEDNFPFLLPGQGLQTLLRIYALLLGLQEIAQPSPVVAQVLEQPGMELMRVDFKSEFAAAIETLLHGLERQAKLQ